MVHRQSNSSQRLRRQIAVIVMLSLSFMLPAIAGIQGSVHDFSSNGWSGGEICNICHTPHTSSNGTQAPLWNHEISSANYTLYNSPTMAVDAQQPSPGGFSRMCLSCHDGTIAIDSYGGNIGGTTITGKANLGTDLRNDHPVGIQWIHQTQSGGSLGCLNCHDINNLSGPPGQELKFFSGKVECPSCHDVHNSRVMDVKLLRKPLAGSQLCLHCHPK